MKTVFVAGSGTDVGKTYVTASLARAARGAGLRVRVCKPLASGLPDMDDPAFAASDPALLLAAAGQPLTAQTLDACSPWRLRAALSPDMAAAAEGRRVTLAEIVAWTRGVLAEPGHDLALVEGVGGVMSPITLDATGLDLALALGVPILLICGTYLGAISHGLCALAALRAWGLEPARLIVNESADSPVPFAATLEAFHAFAGCAPVSALSRGCEIGAVDLAALAPLQSAL